jgi:hypothetical protein
MGGGRREAVISYMYAGDGSKGSSIMSTENGAQEVVRRKYKSDVAERLWILEWDDGRSICQKMANVRGQPP